MSCIKGAPGRMSSTNFHLLFERRRISRRYSLLKMIFVVSILLLAAAVNGQIPGRDYRYRPYDEAPKPYAFSYNTVLDGGIGQISRTESADGSGRVQGSYSLANDEGHTRVVDYIADQDGFRAHVRTNEPGTDNQNPADVVFESSSPYANRNFQYAPASPFGRRPVLNAAPEPIAPEVVRNPVAPENIVPPVRRPRPPTYNRPVYRRPSVRNPYV